MFVLLSCFSYVVVMEVLFLENLLIRVILSFLFVMLLCMVMSLLINDGFSVMFSVLLCLRNWINLFNILLVWDCCVLKVFNVVFIKGFFVCGFGRRVVVGCGWM